jgi:glycerol-3-phosphate acyltransferase PlsY
MSALFCLAAYLLGGLPSGYLLVRWRQRKDVRSMGSGSTGATNVLRAAGWAAAAAVAAADIAKGVLPVVLGRRLFPNAPLVPLAASLAAVLGHCYSPYLRFRGGKGVAVSLGAFAALAPVPALISSAAFAAAVGLTRFVSLGSLLAVALFPVFNLAVGVRPGLLTWMWWGAVLAVVVVRHEGNIRRLLSGNERKLGRTSGDAAG